VINTSGIKIKTVQTKLGTAEVSNVAIKANLVQGEGLQGNVFTSRQHQFQISWPASGWSASETMGPAMLAQQPNLPPTLAIPLVLLRNEPVGNFRPNVNVVVEQIGNMTLASYFKASIGALRQQGWQVLTEDLDEKSQGAFASYLNETTGTKIYQFARIAVSNGKGYVITASQLPLDDGTSDQLRAGLLGILNSFRTISGT
jgi:hypothetical protein